MSSALSSDLREHLGITHILSVCPESFLIEINPQNHLKITVNDSEYEDLLIHLPKACQFIQKALDEGGRILVHCVMGVSRSATVLSAFCVSNVFLFVRHRSHCSFSVMQSKHITASQALEFIRTRKVSRFSAR